MEDQQLCKYGANDLLPQTINLKIYIEEETYFAAKYKL